ncbi:hypothetical protein [Vogesella sp. LIG4]|uniref:hypothetical protein n=1 Tax=Vogesella sp. LIG4 TaxID=1192162 RepID=UPI0012FD0BDD|nr:hypothetical protein [Vogesella sp. LIG4]
MTVSIHCPTGDWGQGSSLVQQGYLCLAAAMPGEGWRNESVLRFEAEKRMEWVVIPSLACSGRARLDAILRVGSRLLANILIQKSRLWSLRRPPDFAALQQAIDINQHIPCAFCCRVTNGCKKHS